VLTGRYDSGFALSLMVKDIGIALGLIRASGAPDAAATAVAAAWAQAAATLPATADHTEIARWAAGQGKGI
jgi:3-hydroxyisobutyrate dehydrogenase